MIDQDTLLPHLNSQTSGRPLTRPFYTDPAVYETDLERIWYSQWIHAAADAEFPKAGAYVTLRLEAYPLVIVRGGDGQIRALHNVCRHRGQRLCSKASGVAARLVCPYHQWTFDTEGKLFWLAQPYIESNFDPKNGVNIVGGHIRLPEGPGLGVVPEEGMFGAPVASFG
jgi:Rieske 2Fe-2S family protein